MYVETKNNKEMAKKTYVPSMDGIPGIIPGTETVLPKPIEVEFPDFTPCIPETQRKDCGQKTVNLNRRMMPSNKK